MNLRLPTSLKLTVPLILLAFAAVLSTFNWLYHVPQAERVAVEDSRKRLAQELSRLQSTLEYLLLKGDLAAAQHEIEVLAHNHDLIVAALSDDRNRVITATRRAWLGQPLAQVLPQFDLDQAAGAMRERRAGMNLAADGNSLLGYAGILLGGERDELRPSRTGSLLLAYDLQRYKAEARTQVVQQSLYWAGWVTALALALWLVFHFLLTRRTARLVHAAEQLAAGDLAVRANLRGNDELGRLGRAFDAMALEVAETQTRLRHDIDERERMQRELEATDERLQQILNNSTALIFARDAEGRFLFVNREWERIFGMKSADVVGRLDRDVRGESRALAYHAHNRLVLERNEPMEFEETLDLDDGLHTYISIKFPLHDADGAAFGVCGIATDITERKRTDEALAASEEQYRSMFNASIDGLALWNAAGELVDTNPALARMYGYAGVAQWSGPSYPGEFLRTVAAGASLHTEASAQRQDGSTLELELHGVPMLYRGQPHVLTIARDITEKKRSASELTRQRDSLYQREKLAALGSLLAGVAHELNNPLSVVVARAVLLEEQGNTSTQAAALKIRSAAERCARIVRTFLAMARQQRPERGPVAMNEVVAAALDIAGYALRSSGVAVQLDLAAQLPLIHADADQLHQVLLNLIINAQQSLQERPAPRHIRIASRFVAATDTLRVTVADNGPGIPEALRARVFEPYFTTKPTGSGIGVGLAVSLGIVEAHGGTLTVDASREGGAAFTIGLPVAAVEPAGDDDELPPAQPGGGARSVLIVDDEAEIRETLTEILTSARHKVVAVASGREALRRIAEERYDVIFTDMRMPDLDGRALYREIEQRWPKQAGKVVFVTGDTLTAGLREFVSASGRPVIEKPFLPSDVRRVVVELAAE